MELNKQGFSIGLVPFCHCGDRFVPTGYRPDTETLSEKLAIASRIADVRGVELDYPSDFTDANETKKLLDDSGLVATNIEIEFFGDVRWKYGALCTTDDARRAEAIRLAQEGMDAAAILGCNQISLWPGQDGFDYPMQVDYRESWDNTVQSVRQIAEYRDDIRVALEYKIKEPRTHIQIGTVGKALNIAIESGCANVGVMVDVGHALMAYENPAESVVILNRQNRLFHLHFNDNYRNWDDDLIVGSVHLWETLELVYWLEEIGYDGWYSLDIFPYREDGVSAIRQSLDNLKMLIEIAAQLDRSTIGEIQTSNNAENMIEFLRNSVLRKE